MTTTSHIHRLPAELLDIILEMAADQNREDGVRFTYGLSRNLMLRADAAADINKYIRGPVADASVRWDASRSIRRVCSAWGEWATRHTFGELHEQRLRRHERWADLPTCRSKYPIYEMNNPRGACISQDPCRGLRRTTELLETSPQISRCVRRLRFDGFDTIETDEWILGAIASCHNLELLALPHRILQRSLPEQWRHLLRIDGSSSKPLRALEIVGARVGGGTCSSQSFGKFDGLSDHSVSFEHLTSLKISGHSADTAVHDMDAVRLSRTARRLQSLQVTGTRPLSLFGAHFLAQASCESIKRFHYRPSRSPRDTGPTPSGNTARQPHLCRLISNLAEVRDLDLSLPAICSCMFANIVSKWAGTCFVRFENFCNRMGRTAAMGCAKHLREVLTAARCLITERSRCAVDLSIELSWRAYVFNVRQETVFRDSLYTEEQITDRRFEQVEDLFRLHESESDDDSKQHQVSIAQSEFLNAMQIGDTQS